MRHAHPLPHGLATVLLLLLCACAEAVPPEAVRTPAEPAPAAATPRYLREFVFVGELADTALVVPFSFSAWQEGGQEGEEISRSARGWVAHGGSWESLLEESASSPAESGMWRVVPTRELRIFAGGSTEIEALLFRRGERALRLRLGEPLADWSGGEDARYRLFGGRLELRGRTLNGPVLEVQRVALADAEGGAGGDYDWLFLSDGGALRLLLAGALRADAPAETFAWMMTAEGERTGERAEIRWLEMLDFPPARREIPLRWSFHLPEAGIEGELWSLGHHAEVGAERAGRRAVEIRYTVEGSVTIEGRQRRVVGIVRHSQG